MSTKWSAMVGTFALLAILAAAGAAYSETGGRAIQSGTIRLERQDESRLSSLAKITAEQAIGKALAEVPGKVVGLGLENEDGYLVYGVEVTAANGSVSDVKVDAGSGKILLVESADDEHAEHEGSRENRSDRDREESGRDEDVK